MKERGKLITAGPLSKLEIMNTYWSHRLSRRRRRENYHYRHYLIMQYINTFLVFLSLSLSLCSLRAEILIDEWSRPFVPITILESRHLITSRANCIKDRSKQRNLINDYKQLS